MNATDASTEPVTVEVPRHGKKEAEGLLIDLTSIPSETITQTSDAATAEVYTTASVEPSDAQNQPSVEEKADEEEKVDKEEEDTEEQGEVEQRVPADIATQRRLEQDNEVETASKGVIEPLKMLKKGATAVVGGTLVGVGLIMIPLPTPCGCVVASSGLAILGSEFEGAKQMNERIIDKSKKNLVKARDKVITKIESLNSDDCDDTDDDSVGSAEAEEETPSWLKHMNETERKRQRKLLKQKYREESMTTNAHFKEYVTKRTGSFLSRTLLPVLNQTKDWPEDETIEISEGCEQLQVDTQSTPIDPYLSPSASETFQKGKEQASESLQKGKEQAKAMFESTAASFSSMMKRMSPQAKAEDESNMDFEEINFTKAAMPPPATSKVENATAAPIAATGTITTEASPAAASVVEI